MPRGVQGAGQGGPTPRPVPNQAVCAPPAQGATPLRKGSYTARIITSAPDLARAQTLRSLCFDTAPATPDHDPFDARCTHVVVQDAVTEQLVCCFRLLPLSPQAIATSYSAQYYNLARLAQYPGPALELGRFCIHPDHTDPDILRLAWAFLTKAVDAGGVQLLFGCASFSGNHATPHLDAFAHLCAKHQAPAHWAPMPKSQTLFDFKTGLVGHKPDPRRAQATLPPLLRSYLLMGGWVSDHAVYDHDLRTMHVFTAVEIAAIPATRARLLRALAATDQSSV